MFAFCWCAIVVTILCSCNGCTQLLEFEDKLFSQNGEDGVLLYLLNLIGVESKYYVEFGVENGAECNSRMLRERLGFTGLSMDGGFQNDIINLQKEFITERNILHLFQKYQVPQRFDVLSLDTDMYDLWILIRLLRDGAYRPRVIVVETNPTLCVANPLLRFEFSECNGVPLTVTHPDLTQEGQEGRWDGTRYAGANPKAFAAVAKIYGYDMLYCESCGVNCFLVLSAELPSTCRVNPGYVDTRSPVHVPQVAYPCFGVPGGVGPGHRVDAMGRAAVELSVSLLNQIRDNALTADAMRAGRRSCGKGGEAWGADWCTLEPVTAFTHQHMGIGTGLDGTAAVLSWAALEGETASVAGRCVTRFKAEEACALAARLYHNMGVEQLHIAAEGQQVELGPELMARRMQVLVAAYNHLLRSEELCETCSGAVRGLLDLLQHYFSVLKARGGVTVTTSSGGGAELFGIGNREASIMLAFRSAAGVHADETELRFSMYDELTAVAEGFCAAHIHPAHAADMLAVEARSGCREEVRRRVLAKATEEFLPGFAFALDVPLPLSASDHVCQAQFPDSSGVPFAQTVLYVSKLSHMSLPPTDESQRTALPGCIAHLVREISAQIMLQC